MACNRCGSWAINHGHHGRDGSEPNLCDVCYWRQRCEQCTASIAAKDAEIARLREALVATFDALDRSSSPFPLSIEMTLAVLDHAKAALSGDAL